MKIDPVQIDGSSRAPVLRFRSNFQRSIDTQHIDLLRVYNRNLVDPRRPAVGNRGDAFCNVLLRGVRDKHSNDLVDKNVISRGEGGKKRKEKKRKEYHAFFSEDIVDEAKNKMKAEYKSLVQ